MAVHFAKHATRGNTAIIESVPWCNVLLSEPGWHRIGKRPPVARNPETAQDSFIAETLMGDNKIEATVSLHSAPVLGARPPGVPPVRHVRSLVALGSQLNSFPSVAHGGLVATLCDEVMGVLLSINSAVMASSLPSSSQPPSSSVRSSGRPAAPPALKSMTANLSIQYLQPVKTPCIICIDVSIDRVEGRKTFLVGSVRNHDGAECSRATAVFVTPRQRTKVRPQIQPQTDIQTGSQPTRLRSIEFYQQSVEHSETLGPKL